jgi:NADPH:quinone reductase-like Zn-dependent oxidoreductase
MKALRHHDTGFKVEDIPTPIPGPKDVLIKVHATSLTADELKWPETKLREAPIPGHDVAGVIAVKGSEVDETFKEGDRVFALTSFSRDGGAAEYMIASSKEVAHMPDNLSFEDASAIPLSALWVYQALFHHVHAISGQKVLITGAGGT